MIEYIGNTALLQNALLVNSLIVNQPTQSVGTLDSILPEYIAGFDNVEYADELEDYADISDEAIEQALYEGITVATSPYPTYSAGSSEFVLGLINKEFV